MTTSTMTTYRCPKCDHVEHQLPAVKDVAHFCPKARRWVEMTKVESVEEKG